MPIAILMPALSPTMETGKLAKWLVKEGDEVTSGDVICEIETDKATMEVETVDDGVVGKILVAEGGDDVAVNQAIAVLLVEGEDASTLEDFDAGAAVEAALVSEPEPVKPVEEPVSSKPLVPVQLPTNSSAQNKRVFASPLARRIASQNSLDIALLSGSGPYGRIIKRDVETAISSGQGNAVTSSNGASGAATMAAGLGDEEIFKLYEPGSYELEPHDSMRKIIAERLTLSKQTVPHFYLTMDCDLDRLLETRARLNGTAPKDDDGKPEWKISVNDFIIKAMAMALQKVPDANASWSENAMLKHKSSDVGVAVSIPGGLITPVVRDAQNKGLSQISIEMKDFAKRARNRKLLPHEYQGGSTAVSNLGMFGIKEFSAVINPPQATILAVGAGVKRAVVDGDSVVVKAIMSVTLSTDHRAVDGALGAQLLGAFKQFIEDPALMLV